MRPLRETYHQRIDALSQNLLRLGSLVGDEIEQSIKALNNRDVQLARQVIESDSRVNALRYEVEEGAYMIIATQQPMATDLRRIVSSISLATNMERMGDHAAGIAQLVIRLGEQPPLKPYVDLPRMADIAREMLRESLDAYITGDADLARRVAQRDDEVDALNDRVLQDLINLMISDPATVTQATYLLWVSHNLERIADRVTNICERIIYIVTGELSDLDHVSQEAGA